MATDWIKHFRWNAEGATPENTDLPNTGFVEGYKPPAPLFNYFFNQNMKIIDQLQREVDDRASGATVEMFEEIFEEVINGDGLTIENGGTGATTSVEAVKNLFNRTLISSSNPVNADTLFDVGFYRCFFDDPSVKFVDYNFPCRYGSLWVFGASSYKAQLCIDVVSGAYYCRATSDGKTWHPWRRIITEKDAGTKGQVLGFVDDNKVAPMTLTADSVNALPNKDDSFTGDMNNLTDGLWRISTSSTNTPVASTAGVCLHKTWDANFAMQLFFPAQDKVYRRVKSVGAWKEWVLLYDDVTMPTPTEYMFQGLITDDTIVSLNTLFNTGVYQVYLTTANQDDYNFPSSISKYGILTVTRGTSYAKQTYNDVINDTMFYRTGIHNGTEWSEWTKSVSESETTKIQTLTYTGTGVRGKSNPNRLTFNFKPQIVFVNGGDHDYSISLKMGQGASTELGGHKNRGWVNITWSGNTVTWYDSETATSATDSYGLQVQKNESGVVYSVTAIG